MRRTPAAPGTTLAAWSIRIVDTAPPTMPEGVSRKHRYIHFKTPSWVADRRLRRAAVRRAWKIAILSTLLCISLTGSFYMWGLDIFKQTIHENLVLQNDSSAFKWWMQPPTEGIFRVYIFNYTGIGLTEDKQRKLKVQEVGPFSYRLQFQRRNHSFNSDDTITYHEWRNFQFAPEMSVGVENDSVVLPNLSLLGIAADLQSKGYFVGQIFGAILRSIGTKPFNQETIKTLLWGGTNPLFEFVKPLIVLRDNYPFDRIGILLGKNETDIHRITIHTGRDNLEELGKIKDVDGKEKLTFWSSEECNKIDGTDGSIFPPTKVSTESRLYLYVRDFCRRIPLIFKEHVFSFGNIPALRFMVPRNVFDNPAKNPENACFCSREKDCLPSGLTDVSPCTFGAPFVISFPHFYLGDPILLNDFEGLQPDPLKHDSYLDIHPKLGTTLDGALRIQVNIRVKSIKGLKEMEMFHDEEILPIAWFEIVPAEVPEDIQQMFVHITHSARIVQLILLYGLPILALVSLYFLQRTLRQKIHQRLPVHITVPANPLPLVVSHS